MINKFSSLAGASAAALVLGLTVLPGTASAGFFDQLFGGSPEPVPQVAPAPAPSYQYDEPSAFQNAPIHRRAKRKVALDEKPKLQKPTDLMHDATLQNGDAVMMKEGLHVYTGNDSESRHSKSDFVTLDEVSGMPKQEHKALVAMDTTRNDPLRGAMNPDTIASGRSAAVAEPVVAGHVIVDVGGKKVRYVGP